MNPKLKSIIMLLVAGLCGALFAYADLTAQQQETDAAYQAVLATVDERLPAVVPQRYKETQERTVKTREAVHAEAQTLSHDALCDALNHELVLYRSAGSDR